MQIDSLLEMANPVLVKIRKLSAENVTQSAKRSHYSLSGQPWSKEVLTDQACA